MPIQYHVRVSRWRWWSKPNASLKRNCHFAYWNISVLSLHHALQTWLWRASCKLCSWVSRKCGGPLIAIRNCFIGEMDDYSYVKEPGLFILPGVYWKLCISLGLADETLPDTVSTIATTAFSSIVKAVHPSSLSHIKSIKIENRFDSSLFSYNHFVQELLYVWLTDHALLSTLSRKL